ncbi:MAG: integration host factor subunit beta [Treponema sp.]|uniref:HU family DNA-binding protein n=1 Tax=Treponema sp. TaxID=166 RepID=UPI0025FFED61|nr:HU family DNA-binding protein [Treponema sp.]MBQ9622609.1 integration host factor subunit beta [Treponema sp.]MBR0496119.1 integration host factor subunit beta [Treponema sp.]
MSVKKVTKSDIVDKVHLNTKIERKVLLDAFEGFIEEFKNALKEGATVELRGFGTLEPRLRNGRKNARNPKTGEILSVEPHYVAAFRAGQELRKAVMELPVDKK